VIEPLSQSDRACNPLHQRTLLSVRPLWHRQHVGRVMVKTPLAFEFSKTRTICDAFDDAWALLQGLGSDLTQAPKSLATQTILAKRIIEMADQGLRDIPALRDGALAFLQHGPPSASRNALGEAINAQAAALLMELGSDKCDNVERYAMLRDPFDKRNQA
jgi:hypothetical protein